MIYHLSFLLEQWYSPFHVIHYVSFRAIAGLLTSLFLWIVAGPKLLTFSEQFFRSRVRDWTPENHQQKNNKPTMGGLFIIGITIISCLLWNNLHDLYVWLLLACLFFYGLIGALDDWQKITKKKGISALVKIIAQLAVGLFLVIILVYSTSFSEEVSFPFFKWLHPNIGPLFIPWALFVIIGTSNAVNLTDGLDGLAIGSLIMNFVTFGLISFLAGNMLFAFYLHIPYAQTAEVAVVAAILVGSSIGFLWYNAYPAQIFMGDVGSLGLGATLGLIALMTKQELLLALAGGLFVVEALSVMLQVFSFKYLGRRIFKMAPLHHHFELLGWQEAKITTRFSIISFVLCLLALVTLKLR